jgi:mannose-6-phosphate isomerase-like protein (cupin superfamily)
MPKVSRQTATLVHDYGVAEDRHEELDGYSVNFVLIRQGHDLAPMLAALPGGRCPCPHWGYLVKGRLTVRYGDHEEVIEAGDAFYLPPGHTPEAEEGTEIVQFSPAKELAAVDDALKKAMEQSP